ncbi:hypothetical protein ABVD54_003435 [Vibrio parahaemolyticus]|uniref:hypothetical protein n=1 Tax=Vibrio parahaemolyticus TaxID=670 RepID=UPI000471DF6F|nr:hypothetical protein [Vibrio parahaemolyticus]EGQ7814862.1 hypothetical protein [Vibrio parahaemolyticus]EHR6926793.1 hypothetical protein [Vibrio parahaemolyticus]MDF4960853.1 hypothetical protein [Vibrio parahaemolyticus]MDF5299331.1 hypothetical protein [Vibrio parahaemolyticus]MDF5580225.1 hypothetical protein [Vibrio parahaemolyticus]
MEIIELFVSTSSDYFRPILVLITSIFAIYFAWKKIGHNIMVQYSVVHEGFSAPRINEIILSNNKDKPVSVYSIYATFDNDLLLELKKFSPPEVLKPYETIGIFTDQYSALRVNNDDFSPNFLDAEIWVESAEKTIRCKARKRQNLLANYRKVSKNCHKFNGFVFDETVAYILSYVVDKRLKTAFIHFSGYIGNEWDFSPNHLGDESKVNVATIMVMLAETGLGELFSDYQVIEVVAKGWGTKVVANKHNKAFKRDSQRLAFLFQLQI